MNNLKLKFLRDFPEFREKASYWFSSQWNIPVEAYRESIKRCTECKDGIPQWYIFVDEQNNIVAGAGVIENDFHERKDLSPNVCALFVEEAYRNRGIAKHMLDCIRRDWGGLGFARLYLVTDHAAFYEKCGWTFLTTVRGEDGLPERMYAATTLK